MKKYILFLLVFTIHNVYAQNAGQFRQPVPEKSLPKLVKLTFQSDYKDALVYDWYVTHIIYWYEDYSGNWYNNWYTNRPVVVYTFSDPAYFEVEFSMEIGEISRAIYNRYGYWFETRTKLSGLPANIVNALKQSKYADWKWSNHKERLEAPGMPGSVYRLRVSKGMRSVIIRLDDKGNFIQSKETDNFSEPGTVEKQGRTEKQKDKK